MKSQVLSWLQPRPSSSEIRVPTPPITTSNPPDNSSPESFRATWANAIRYWEPRRLFYNLVLTAVVFTWIAASWPHFRPAFNLTALFLLVILGLIANACYCAAYLIDIPLQQSSLAARWKNRRWTLWWIGMLFAVLLANYWIADEIYPFVQ
jgi:hypothetical protein